MLESTFVHAQGVGFTTERKLWRKGAVSWSLFSERVETLGLSKRIRSGLEATVAESVAALDDRSAGYFARALPAREHWRAAASFPRLGYLDIETDGDVLADSVTVIGLFDGFETRAYVKGSNLEDIVDDCEPFEGFVTFFGGGFDLPMLRRRFPALDSVFRSRLHIDLCPALRRLGFSGGLKNIEARLGVRRIPETEGLDGMDAIRLWNAYRRGGAAGDQALRLLLAYNREDVVNLKTLLEFALPGLRRLSGIDEEP